MSGGTTAKIGGLSELKRRLLFVLIALIVYRIGAHIPVPGLPQCAMGRTGGCIAILGLELPARGYRVICAPPGRAGPTLAGAVGSLGAPDGEGCFRLRQHRLHGQQPATSSGG